MSYNSDNPYVNNDPHGTNYNGTNYNGTNYNGTNYNGINSSYGNGDPYYYDANDPNNPYGNAPYGNDSYGNAPYGNDPYGGKTTYNGGGSAYDPSRGNVNAPVPDSEKNGQVLGILSICLAFFTPIIALILGIVGLTQAKKNVYNRTPRTLSIIGIVMSAGIWIIGILIYIFLWGFMASLGNKDPEEIERWLEKYIEENDDYEYDDDDYEYEYDYDDDDDDSLVNDEIDIAVIELKDGAEAKPEGGLIAANNYIIPVIDWF